MTTASPSCAHAQLQRPSLKTVVINGSLYKPSRTQTLLEAVHTELVNLNGLSLTTEFIEVADFAKELGSALSFNELTDSVKQAIESAQSADFLIIGCPVYKGAMPGLFKHFFDLMDMNALMGKPVFLAATGGSVRHSLVIDLQIRPLFNFFQALVMPIGVFAVQTEIQAGVIVDEVLKARIRLAAQLAQPALLAHQDS